MRATTKVTERRHAEVEVTPARVRRGLCPRASAAVVVSPNTGSAATPNRVLGVYAGAAYPPAVPAFTTTLGSQPRFAMDFISGTTWHTITQPHWPYPKWKGKGYTMIWGVDMLPDTYSPNTDAVASRRKL